MSVSLLQIAVAISEVIAFVLIRKIWKTDDFIFFKITLSVIALIPFFGPFFVLWISNFPPPQADVFRDKYRNTTDVYDRWRGVLEEKNPISRYRKWRALVGKDSEIDNP